jgi:hypothetical protein
MGHLWSRQVEGIGVLARFADRWDGQHWPASYAGEGDCHHWKSKGLGGGESKQLDHTLFVRHQETQADSSTATRSGQTHEGFRDGSKKEIGESDYCRSGARGEYQTLAKVEDWRTVLLGRPARFKTRLR